MKLSVSPISVDQSIEYSHGEVLYPETISFRNGMPIPGGLFCQSVFGPLKDYTCACGKLSGKKYEGSKCDKCGVEVAHSDVRGEWFGRIDLIISIASPALSVSISSILGLSKKEYESFILGTRRLFLHENPDGCYVLNDGTICSIDRDPNPNLSLLFDFSASYGLGKLFSILDPIETNYLLNNKYLTNFNK
jgi:DNA-directed RNA polymerase beta' subunit